MKLKERKKGARIHEVKPRQARRKASAGQESGSLPFEHHTDIAFISYDAAPIVTGGKIEEKHAAVEFQRTLGLIEESRQRAQRTQEEIDRLKRQTKAILDKLLTKL